MRTSELKKELAKLHLIYEADTILDKDRHSVAYVDKYNCFEMDTNVNEFRILSLKNKQKLWSILFEYAETPIEERKDENQFKVHVLPYDKGYINQDLLDDILFLDNGDENRYHKTIFTESEWNEIRGYLPAYDENNPMFEEVIEDD